MSVSGKPEAKSLSGTVFIKGQRLRELVGVTPEAKFMPEPEGDGEEKKLTRAGTQILPTAELPSGSPHPLIFRP